MRNLSSEGIVNAENYMHYCSTFKANEIFVFTIMVCEDL
jgi:hypothetical protein